MRETNAEHLFLVSRITPHASRIMESRLMTFMARLRRNRRSQLPLCLSATAAVSALVGVAALRAQPVPASQPVHAEVQQALQAKRLAAGGINPDAMAGKDGQEGVFVRDSALAV